MLSSAKQNNMSATTQPTTHHLNSGVSCQTSRYGTITQSSTAKVLFDTENSFKNTKKSVDGDSENKIPFPINPEPLSSQD